MRIRPAGRLPTTGPRRPGPAPLARARLTLALLGAAAAAGPALGQGRPEARLDAMLVNRYLWRGIPRAAGWSAQPQASVGWLGAATRVSAGVWANLELASHRDSSLTDRTPGSAGLSEVDGWVEVAHRTRGADLAAGVIWYEHRTASGRDGTGEVYARVRATGLGRAVIAPTVSVWYDPIERNAGYAEAGVTVPVLALPFLRPMALLYSGATAGLAIGRAEGGPALRRSWFDGPGFTSATVSAGLRARTGVGVGTLIVNLGGHLVVAGDSAVRRRSLRPGDVTGPVRTYFQLELGLTWPPVAER